VGFYDDSHNASDEFLFSNGSYTTLTDPKGVDTLWDVAINDKGQITGEYVDPQGAYHSFLFSNGRYTTVDDPHAGSGIRQGTYTIHNGINGAGQIIGFYIDSSGSAGYFLFSKGKYTTLAAPLAGTSEAVGIDAKGQVFGDAFKSKDGVGAEHGFLFSHGKYTTLNDGSHGTYFVAVNAGGEAIGTYVNAHGVGHWFLATPRSSKGK